MLPTLSIIYSITAIDNNFLLYFDVDRNRRVGGFKTGINNIHILKILLYVDN